MNLPGHKEAGSTASEMISEESRGSVQVYSRFYSHLGNAQCDEREREGRDQTQGEWKKNHAQIPSLPAVSHKTDSADLEMNP